MKKPVDEWSEARTVAEILFGMARRRGEAPAIEAPGRAPLSYAGLAEQAEETARQLRAANIGRADRVATVLPNGPEMAVAFAAISAAAVCAPLNPQYKRQDFEFYLADLRPKALLVEEGGGGAALEAAAAQGIRVLRLKRRGGEGAGRFVLDAGGYSGEVDWGGSQDMALLLHTSGTTSRPKLVPLTSGNLVASSDHIARTLGLGPEDRCLNIMPLFHIHGLMAAVLATLRTGGTVVCTDGEYRMRFFEWVKSYRPSWYTAVPTMHQGILLLARGAAEVMREFPLRLIRSSSASLPTKVLMELEQAFGAPVIEAYGMTEAAHQIASNPIPPDVRKPGTVGPASGPEVGIMDEEGHLLPAGFTGEVVIRGANVTPGYEDNEAANRVAFADGWFRTGDQGRLDEQGYLFLTGRLKELINRGGEKISPREVDEVLLGHPAVKQAVTFAIVHAQFGEEVGAAVELKSAGAVSEIELRRWSGERLADFKRPRVIRIVEEIPRGATGKLQRIGLAEKLGIAPLDDTKSEAVYVAPRTELEERIAGLWQTMLRLERVGVRDRFAWLGGDSLIAAKMLVAVCEKEQVEPGFTRFLEEGTVEAVARDIEEWRGDGLRGGGLVLLQRGREGPPLFCLPGHDGVVLGLGMLARELGSERKVWAFALNDMSDAASMEELATRCLLLMKAQERRGPYRLAGTCFGGLVAYEMARQLEAAGDEVEFLTIIDALNPAWPRGQGPLRLAMSLARQWKQKLNYHVGQIRGRPGMGKVWYATGRLAAFASNYAEHAVAFMRRSGIYVGMSGWHPKIHRRQIAGTYRPRCYGGKAIVVKMCGRRLDAPALGWTGLIKGGLELVEMPFHSNGALGGENAARVAAVLREKMK